MKNPLIIFLFFSLFLPRIEYAQNAQQEQEITVLNESKIVGPRKEIYLPDLVGWKFSPKDDPASSSEAYDDTNWYLISKPLTEKQAVPDSLWNGFGWFRLKVKIDFPFFENSILQSLGGSGALEFYINDSLVFKRGNPSPYNQMQELEGVTKDLGDLYQFEPGKTYQLAARYSFHNNKLWNSFSYTRPRADFDLGLISYSEVNNYISFFKSFTGANVAALVVLLMVMLLHFFLYQKEKSKDGNFWIFLITLCIFIYSLSINLEIALSTTNYLFQAVLIGMTSLSSAIALGLIPIVTHKVLEVKPHTFWKNFLWYMLIAYALDVVYRYTAYFDEQINLLISLLLVVTALVGGITGSYKAIQMDRKDVWLIAGSLIAFPVLMILGILISILEFQSLFLFITVFFLLFVIIPLGMSLYQGKKFLRMHTHLDSMVEERTTELELAMANLRQSHEELKATQNQLVQQEKLASLGQLTAGIAHEIKNPLNFVTNFSDICLELIDDAKAETIAARKAISTKVDLSVDCDLLKGLEELLENIEENLHKIFQHGNRADAIVKSMLLHSRGGSGQMELTNLNNLVREYTYLAYHGMRASSNPINVSIEMHLDEQAPKISLIAEDFSRVILNLCTNSFDAMKEKIGEPGYKAILKVNTQVEPDHVEISIEDNGPGINKEIIDKILQPFFTTKKGTEGTGLGLSLSHETIKAQGGELKVVSPPAKGAKFIIILPVSKE